MGEARTRVIVCHCTGTTDREIRTLVREGRAASILEVSRSCSAALGCGGCRGTVERIVCDEHNRRRTSLTELAPAV